MYDSFTRGKEKHKVTPLLKHKKLTGCLLYISVLGGCEYLVASNYECVTRRDIDARGYERLGNASHNVHTRYS